MSWPHVSTEIYWNVCKLNKHGKKLYKRTRWPDRCCPVLTMNIYDDIFDPESWKVGIKFSLITFVAPNDVI